MAACCELWQLLPGLANFFPIGWVKVGSLFIRYCTSMPSLQTAGLELPCTATGCESTRVLSFHTQMSTSVFELPSMRACVRRTLFGAFPRHHEADADTHVVLKQQSKTDKETDR
eukprot:1527005-Amphidinium_carterae.1